MLHTNGLTHQSQQDGCKDTATLRGVILSFLKEREGGGVVHASRTAMLSLSVSLRTMNVLLRISTLVRGNHPFNWRNYASSLWAMVLTSASYAARLRLSCTMPCNALNSNMSFMHLAIMTDFRHSCLMLQKSRIALTYHLSF